jgi:ribosomal protein S27AE
LKRRRIPGQVIRLGIVFAILIVVLLVVRARFVPPSFGRWGHYRAEAVKLNADRPIRYAGLPACAECHVDEADLKASSYHRGLTCEGCHGPAADHAADPTATQPLIPRDRKTCLRCHEYRFSRPTGFPQIIESVHNPVEPCTTCHDPHDPTPPETPEECSACHAAIARTKAVSHHRSIDCRTCHEVPSGHRVNPRAFLPSKPRDRAFCGQCHAPTATRAAEAPRVDIATHGGRYLCWQCHYPHFPEGK